jgi:hypothetical protein
MLAWSAVKGAFVNVHVIPVLVKVRLPSILKMLIISADNVRLPAVVSARRSIQDF